MDKSERRCRRNRAGLSLALEAFDAGNDSLDRFLERMNAV
jgi:predicted HTH domain antitoxin